jgi:hypothetical protein
MERKPITFEILEKIINVLLHVCNSYYEATLFAACFSVAFFGFLRVGEFALSQNSERLTLNIYGLNDKIKLLVPLVLHSNNLSYF